MIREPEFFSFFHVNPTVLSKDFFDVRIIALLKLGGLFFDLVFFVCAW